MADEKTLITLNSAANQILAVVAPGVSRVVSAQVVVREGDGTAATNGVVVYMPQQFCGCEAIANSKVAVGLMAHEIGHFLQPTEDMTRIEGEHGVPHWLSNILMDIHGETVVELIFPAFAHPLSIVRQLVRSRMLDKYDATLGDRTKSFADHAQAAALRARFHMPASGAFNVFGSSNRRLTEFLNMLNIARGENASDLPVLAVKIIRKFPELKVSQPSGGAGGGTDAADLNPLNSVTSDGSALPAVRGEAAGITVLGAHDHGTEAIRTVSVSLRPPEPEAQQLANQIAVRFERPRGEMAISAPGDLDRLDLARGSLVPFIMSVRPGVERPAPRVVIVLDKSSSMRDDGCTNKWTRAKLAAQAIALAIREQDGDVRAVMFDSGARCALDYSSDLLFSTEMASGDTSFTFLSPLWRQFPEHLFILVTDGDGELPNLVLPADKIRTIAVVIPPQASVDSMRQIAREVMQVNNLAELPLVLGLLIPRVMVA